MNFYKRHLGDIGKACAHLSQGQMGAYDLLLDWLYGNEKPLPLAPEALYRIGRAVSKSERQNVDAVLAEFFTRTPDGYEQRRASAEMAKANAQADTNRRIAEEREARRRATKAARTEHESCNESGHESFDEPCTKRQPSQTPDSRQEQEQVTFGDSSPAPAAPTPVDVPPCPHEEILALYHELLPMLPRVREWTPARQQALRSRWREKRQRQTLDWWRRFFGYVAASDFLTGRVAQRPGHSWECSLPWLLKAENFAKVVEGHYENREAA